MTMRKEEWLETDGLGGFASGTISGIRTRRYHGLLTVATTPPTGRILLVNGFDGRLETPVGEQRFTSECYAPDIVDPAGFERIESFTTEPWPTWTYRLDDDRTLTQEVLMMHGGAVTVIRFTVSKKKKDTWLVLRPFLSGRNAHSLHAENKDFNFTPIHGDGRITWRPYAGVPGIIASADAEWIDEPLWYRRFLYSDEKARGYDHTEDLAAPGVFRFDMSKHPAVLILGAEGHDGLYLDGGAAPRDRADALIKMETKRRKRFASRLERAADAYIVRRGQKKTIVAGYPWFTDWGRDTFIAMRGLCLATERFDDAESILDTWAAEVSSGMLPNRFTEEKDAPEFNAVDASLWFIVAVHDFLEAADRAGRAPARDVFERLTGAVKAILDGYEKGTRHGIRMTADGLIAAGEPGVQLTWMDAKIGDWVVTPRIGKPVEVQALWINALEIGALYDPRRRAMADRARASFLARFWNPAKNCLFDVCDAHHRAGEDDDSIRPNQILAVGGLPFPVLTGERAKAVVDVVLEKLLTPAGLRSLAPDHSAFAPTYEGGPTARDGAYHQGTVWLWLMGPFIEAWVRTHGDGDDAREEARRRFFEPFLARLDDQGLGHLAEIADATSPYTLRGAPFQAWSMGEALRTDRVTLRLRPKKTDSKPPRAAAAKKKAAAKRAAPKRKK